MRDIIEEFNKLKQEGTVQAYQLKFEELRSLMMVHNPHLSEEYYVSSFISGLGDEVETYGEDDAAPHGEASCRERKFAGDDH